MKIAGVVLLLCGVHLVTTLRSTRSQLRLQVVEMIHHAYDNYMQHAYPGDELMPLSCQGRFRGKTPDRGDIDESCGNFAMTLIDSLDTLAVIGDVDRFEKGVSKVINEVRFDSDVVVSVFETNIRVLGGLISAHVMAKEFKQSNVGCLWYRDELLYKAIDIANRLMPAFNTSTGVPYSRVNLKYGVNHPKSRVIDKQTTCTACAGTFMLEFTALSILMGDSAYEAAARRAMDYIWSKRNHLSDLVGTVMNVKTGEWVRKDSGLGAGIDSYYEYMYKAYILLQDTNYLHRFNKHYSAILKYIQQGHRMLNVNMIRPQQISKGYMDSLSAFWPGLQVMKGDLKSAVQLHEMLYHVVKQHKFLPEAFTSDFNVHWAHHPIRPEFVESTYFLYKATQDHHYLDVAEHVVEAIHNYTRVPCGFAALANVRTGQKEDRFDSFVISETFKYLYLIFSKDEEIWLDMDDYIFTTEAHLIPLGLRPGFRNSTFKATVTNPMTEQRISILDDTCFNFNLHNKPNWASDLRKMVGDSLKPSQISKISPDTCIPSGNGKIPVHVVTSTGQKAEPSTPANFQTISAADFDANNQMHAYLLGLMGIDIVTTASGDVQLVHMSSKAHNSALNQAGVKFMSEMIKLTSQPSEASSKIAVIQIMSHPYWGGLSLRAGAALFGPDLSSNEVVGETVSAYPLDGCSVDSNYDVAGYVVVAMRGGCMFAEKARAVQERGAIGLIVVDDKEDSSIRNTELFSLSSDNDPTPVHIPTVFIFHKEGIGLLSLQLTRGLKVRLAGSALNLESLESEMPSELFVQYYSGKMQWGQTLENLYAATEELYYDDEYMYNAEDDIFSVGLPVISDFIGPQVVKRHVPGEFDDAVDTFPQPPSATVKQVEVHSSSAEVDEEMPSVHQTIMKHILASIRESKEDTAVDPGVPIAAAFYQESMPLGVRLTKISKFNLVQTSVLKQSNLKEEQKKIIRSFKKQGWPKIRLERLANGVTRLRGFSDVAGSSDAPVEPKLLLGFEDEVVDSVLIDLHTGQVSVD